ncbi:type II toxin-antitoxin system HipA family toxin [Herbaspirillum sp. WKF16]|uniref:type II toxin-antitoxin system HipA family toxin n=1 Tax=Herbaspirillum sp. WKF16 TaxID=3028312 RepID=UPI0023A98F79|nr:type II toxin-antitoxin system HipA family toxin [Herbaspirillum sp. WKF16]WDZ96406.1 type II toxin-antitoxin system HipA family toxin [Herbaspirillum sp. WKF16]
MNGQFVGTWTLSPQGEQLQYADAWVNAPGARPLSLSLPFMPGNLPHRGEVVHNYFDNLLPDSKAIRERIARKYRTKTSDAFGLLAEIGRDCVGALQILPQSAASTGIVPIEATALSDDEVAQLLRDTLTPAAPGLPDSDDFRISIAGAQEKTALLRYRDRWCMPHGPTPTTHILKLPLGLVGGQRYDMRHSVENEWLCAQILAAYGMPVASCDIARFGDMTVLSVERFDRTWWQAPEGDLRLLRLPQEDMCQATGAPPWLKYEADGGPSMDAIMRLLSGSIDRVAARRRFFEAQVLFWMLWATDGHAKNFSLFLRAGGAYELTPLYDVLSVYPILGEGPGKLSPFKAKMAMAVRSRNDHWKMREIVRRHWIAVGEKYGIVSPDGQDPEQILAELAAKTTGVIASVRSVLASDFPSSVSEPIFDGLASAAEKLAA